MNFKELIKDYGQKATETLIKNMKILEDNMITIQGNQVEQEAYLKDMTERLRRIEDKLVKR